MPKECIPILLAVILAISVITDIRTQKIYNWVTFPGILAGIALNAIAFGGRGVLFSIEGIGVSMAWLVLVLLRGSGFGDLKLLLVVGAMMGWKFTAWTLAYTVVAGGVLGIFYTMSKGGLGLLKHTGRNALFGAHVFAVVKSPDAMTGMVEQSKAGKMAYAPAIAIGVLMTWLLQGHFTP